MNSEFFEFLAFGLSFSKSGEHVDGHGEESCRVMFAGDLAHCLEESELKGDRFFADHCRRLNHLFRGLELALGIDDFGAAFAFGLGLFGHGSFHAFRERHILNFDRSHFDAPRIGLAINDFLKCLVDFCRGGRAARPTRPGQARCVKWFAQ